MNCPACNAIVAENQRFCSVCGQSLDPANAPNAAVDAGERRQATVVFSDLSGYTALNEKLDPEEVEEIMSRVKREATRVVEKHGGIVNQFVGDEIMSFFGVPVARRDDPHRAVRAAMELHRVVRETGMELAGRIGHPLTMHTGINTGLIVVRRKDSREGRYAVTGDPINTGARLLKLADTDEIVVGQDTWRQISDEFVGEASAPIEVKGKERPVTPYRVRSERTAADKMRRALVGRAKEMDLFATFVRTCVEQERGHLIILRGDPGLGKSRLAQEFVSVAEQGGLTCHSALVLDFSTERGRDTIRSLVRGVLAVWEDAGEIQRRATIRRLIDNGVVASDRELFLCDLLNVSPPAELRTIQAAMTEEARNKGTSATLCDLVRRACAQSPVLLLVEDIHWADSWTLELLAALAALTGEHKLLLTLTTRVEGDPSVLAWRASLHNVPLTAIDLSPLPQEEALRFAEQFGVIPSMLADSFVARAEGNPLFLQQLLLNAEEVGQSGLPGSIQALVLARMDRLLATHRKAIQAAAVLGQRFSVEALRGLLVDPEYQCTALIEHFLVRPEGMDYLFCHALIRDGAYESLLKSRRRELHTRSAEWFSDHDPGVAAEHDDRAGHPRAARTYLAASEAEAVGYHYSSALVLVERGLALATDREDKFSLASMRAKILDDMGRAHESIVAWRIALDSSEGASERCAALIGGAQAMRIVDRTDEGLEALAEAEPLAQESKRSLELSRLYHLRGNYYFVLGKADECLHEHEIALRWAREAGSVEAEASALGGLGDAHYLSGRMRSAYEQFSRCVQLANQHGLGRIEVANRHMVGWSQIYLNELRSALKVGLETTQMAVAVSHPRGEILGRLLHARATAWMIGDTQSARFQLDAALKLCQALGAKRFESECMVDRAFLELRDGNRELAELLAREALQFCREHGMDFFGTNALGLVSRLTPDPAERMNLNAEAEARLKRGAISHNHFEFYANAIESALERSAWNEAEHYCDALEQYTASEPLPLCDLQIARGRRLAQFGRGARNDELLADLSRLRAQAVRHEYGIVVPMLDAALKQIA